MDHQSTRADQFLGDPPRKHRDHVRAGQDRNGGQDRSAQRDPPRELSPRQELVDEVGFMRDRRDFQMWQRRDDETQAFAAETAELREQSRRHEARLDWVAGLTSLKAVLLEGLEVVFIVLAVGAGRGLVIPASIGALAACLAVAALGFAVHRPLARVPENTLKFSVGVILSAFGVFWTGEGLGISWPGEDLAIIGFAALFLVVALLTVALLRRPRAEVLP
jgi:uncharacterized membrane protein